MTSRSHFVASLTLLASFASTSALIASDAQSQPIRDNSWQVVVGTTETAAATAVANNDAGPKLAQSETPPAPEGTTLPLTEIGPSPAPEATPSAVIAGDAVNLGSATPKIIPSMSYMEAYNSVVFNRTEYEANPSYRHEAALEMMFGQLRQTTTVKQYTPRVIRYPDFYQYPYARYPYMRVGVQNSWNAYGIPYPLYAR